MGSQGWGSWATVSMLTPHSSASTSLMYCSRYSFTAGMFSYLMPVMSKVWRVPKWKLPSPQVLAMCST